MNTKGQKSIAWFWLTDSYSFLELGKVKLFESSAESLKKYPQEPRYLDYQYIRFLEDFFDILPTISMEIPQNIYRYIDTNAKQEALIQKLNDWYYEAPETEESEVFYDTLASFLMDWGRLSTGHLAVQSIVSFLHVGENVLIRYDFTGSFQDGTPVWSAGKGEFIIPFSDFVDEVEDLLHRFFARMDLQVQDALLAMEQDKEHKKYSSSYIENQKHTDASNLELDCLSQEHEERRTFFYSKFHDFKNGTMAEECDWSELAQHLATLVRL